MTTKLTFIDEPRKNMFQQKHLPFPKGYWIPKPKNSCFSLLKLTTFIFIEYKYQYIMHLFMPVPFDRSLIRHPYIK